MVTLEGAFCEAVCVVVWAGVCVDVAAVVVIVLGGVMLCREDINLLCEGRLMVGEIGLCLICWSSGSAMCLSSSLSSSGVLGTCGGVDFVGRVVVNSVGVGSASAMEPRFSVCWSVRILKSKSWMDGSGSARTVVLSCRLISMRCQSPLTRATRIDFFLDLCLSM